MKTDFWAQADWRSFGLGFVSRLDMSYDRWVVAEGRIVIGPFLVGLKVSWSK
jgi:hypothetical protein